MKEKLNSYFIPEGYIIEKVEVAVLEEEGTEQENGAYSIQIQMIPDSMEVSAVKINKVSISEDGEDTGDTASVREEGLKEKAAEVLEIDAERIEVMLNVPDMEESNEREVYYLCIGGDIAACCVSSCEKRRQYGNRSRQWRYWHNAGKERDRVGKRTDRQ